MNAMRRAAELMLLEVRLKEMQDELPREAAGMRTALLVLRYGAASLVEQLREYARTGPDCVRDIPNQPTMVTPADAGTEI